MAKLTKAQKQKIEKYKKDIKEGDSLWEKIKNIPKEDKLFLKQLKQYLKPHRVKKKKTPKTLKKKADKVFWGLEPPEKKSKKPKR